MSIEWLHDSTHADLTCKCFYKKVEGVWHLIYDDGSSSISSSLYNGDTNEIDLVERPQPKPWSGPEDGLPSFDKSLYICTESHGTLDEIPGVHMRDYGSIVVLREKDQIHIYQKKTPEQIRETAIRELMDIAQVDCRVTAARLVDAGFKRGVV